MPESNEKTCKPKARTRWANSKVKIKWFIKLKCSMNVS
jgi:hypothetical protein